MIVFGDQQQGRALVPAGGHLGGFDDGQRGRDTDPAGEVPAVDGERHVGPERPACRHHGAIDPEPRTSGERSGSIEPLADPSSVFTTRPADATEVVPQGGETGLRQCSEQLLDERVVHVAAVLGVWVGEHDDRRCVGGHVVLGLEGDAVVTRDRQVRGGSDFRIHRPRRYLAPVAHESKTPSGSDASQKRPIKMLHDRILVRMPSDEAERRSSGGILIPATAQQQKRLVWGEVVGAGPNVRSAEEGDQVLFSPEDRHEVEVQGDDFLILRERDVHAIAAPRVEPGSTGLYL